MDFCFGIISVVRRLAIRPGAIGDLILSLPALESLRTDYLEVWVPSRNAPLVRFADGVRPIASTGLDLLGITDPPADPAREPKPFRFHRLLVRRESPGFPRTGGEPEPPVPLLSRPPPSSGRRSHATDFYLDQVRDLCESDCDPIPRIPCDVPRRELRRDSPVLRQRPQELAAREIPPASAQPGAHSCRSAGVPGPTIRRSTAPSASTISTSWRAGWPARASTSATIPASPTWRPPSELPCWRYSAPPIPPSGRRAARTCG